MTTLPTRLLTRFVNLSDETLEDWAVFALFAVGVVARAAWVYVAAPMSYDETFTAILARLPFERMIAATAGDVHPPLFYALEWGMARLVGSDGSAMRILPALFSSLGLLAAVQLGKELCLNSRALLGLVLIMALSPFQLHFAADARMYPLLQWLVLQSAVYILQRKFFPLMLVGVALMWTHNYAVIYWPVLGMLALAHEALHTSANPREWPDYWPDYAGRSIPARARWGFLIAAFAVPLVLYAPWAWHLAGQIGAMSSIGYWIPPLTLGEWLMPIHLHWWSYETPSPFSELGLMFVLALLILALWRALKDRGLIIMAAWLLLAPMLIAGLISVCFRNSIYLARALIGCAVPGYILVAWLMRRAGVAKSLAVYGPLVVIMLLASNQPRPNGVDTAREYIAAHARPGDVIYHGNVGTWVTFHTEDKGLNPLVLNHYLMPPIVGSTGVLSSQTRSAMGMIEIPFDDLPAGRVWLVWGATPTIVQAEDDAVAAILAKYPNEQVINIDNILPDQAENVDGGVWLVWR